MPAEVILAIDQGTTNTKALLVDRSGTPRFSTSAALDLIHPQPGFVEQNPHVLWTSVLDVIDVCLRKAKEEDLRVAGIAISNQRETAVAWRPGSNPQPVANAISWQCRRSVEICNALKPHHASMQSITGLPVDPLASAGKWSWLLAHEPALRAEAIRGDLLLGNIDAWILSKLTNGKAHATDHTNASRTGLFSLIDLDWNHDLLGFYGIPRIALPSVQASASNFGVCTAIAGLEGVPIIAMIGDSHAALVGHGSYTPGSAKATYGTGSSLMMLTGEHLPEAASLARTIAFSDPQGVQFALEGNITMTGSAVQWVGEFLGMARPIEDTVALADSVPDAAGLRFVPAMAGLGAPHWDAEARGLVANLGRSHRAGHLARAAVDAIALQVADVLFSMEAAYGSRLETLRVDGGATRNNALMQFQADLIGRPVVRSANEELSAVGASFLGGLTLDWWPTALALENIPKTSKIFTPCSNSEDSVNLYRSWQVAVDRARSRPDRCMR